MTGHTMIQAALRAKILTLSVATTGAIAMSATTTGYVRTPIAGVGTVSAAAGAATFTDTPPANGSLVTVGASTYVVSASDGVSVCRLSGAPTFAASAFTWTGSFIVDGLAAGMEVKPSGFASALVGTIKSVSADVVTISGGRTAEASASGRTLVVGAPSARANENVGPFIPTAGVPYLEEQYLPGPAFIANDGYAGVRTLRPMYSPRVYAPVNTDIFADGAYADAILALFAPGTTITLSSGDHLVVRADVAPYPGQRAPGVTAGWSCIPVNIPLELRTASVPS